MLVGLLHNQDKSTSKNIETGYLNEDVIFKD